MQKKVGGRKQEYTEFHADVVIGQETEKEEFGEPDAGPIPLSKPDHRPDPTLPSHPILPESTATDNKNNSPGRPEKKTRDQEAGVVFDNKNRRAGNENRIIPASNPNDDMHSKENRPKIQEQVFGASVIVYFPIGSASLKEKQARLLDHFIFDRFTSKNIDPGSDGNKIVLEGHSDARGGNAK